MQVRHVVAGQVLLSEQNQDLLENKGLKGYKKTSNKEVFLLNIYFINILNAI